MRRKLTTISATLLTGGLSAGLLLAQGDSQPLRRLAAAERAFAAATAEIGVRDGFLTFFAEDAISISPGPDGTSAVVGRAREGLQKMTAPQLPLASKLIWEPFTGHVSNDGSLGWLTGAFVNTNQSTGDTLRKGAYFSVWKRQPDGTWRVWIDEGISLPQPWKEARPFRPAPEPDAGSLGSPAETLDAVEAAVAGGDEPWRGRLAADLRLHRDAQMPLVGRGSVIEWCRNAWKRIHYTVARTAIAGSGDLGVALGGYDAVTPNGNEHGTWVRVWKRDAAQRWRIVFETSKAAP